MALLRRAAALCALLVPLLASAAPAVADTTHCFIRRTFQGPVALRDAPRADAALVRHMRAGDELMVFDAQPPGPWTRVRHAPGGAAYDTLVRTAPGRIREGWVARRLLADCDA